MPLTKTLTDESETEYEDDIDRITKRRRVAATRGSKDNKNSWKNVIQPEETIESILAGNKNKNPPMTTNNPKNKTSTPPIVIDGKTANQSSLLNDIKEIVKGKFSIKHTNNSTILFVDDREDHMKMVENIKADKLPFHTYATKDDKTDEFVLRGLADGTKIADIEEDLQEEYKIKIKEIYRMNTKNQPLFLVVTDPSMTLDYLNKNIQRVLYTRVT
ncbi:unnamed protein product [Psylliodes chrysocephalus]|uniref:Uncharacterized protein n=1 Tax=Psylliodes chrysocephalus TaxID=3402493 RepID=A0A9P0CG99_9CUCU|nr:unnamed protein product [Psylliodes chrysocephala]